MIDATERRGAEIEPREIRQDGDAGLCITWGDGNVCSYNAAVLKTGLPLCPMRQ